MKTLCDGSRRPVRGERHGLKATTTRHTSAVCPVCRQTLRVARVMGVFEFPRHLAKDKAGEKTKDSAKVKATVTAKPKAKAKTPSRAKAKAK